MQKKPIVLFDFYGIKQIYNISFQANKPTRSSDTSLAILLSDLAILPKVNAVKFIFISRA